jgi:hypothetical protein
MVPGRALDRAIEDFWFSVYNGSFHLDHEELERRGNDLAEYLALRDQYQDLEPDHSLEPGFNMWEQAKRRSSAVSGMSVFALEQDRDNVLTYQERSSFV